ncbi:hypothetical protein ACO2Q8_01745 [Larkinella sp. VNQ87]|uniref:hypothetical protein n=1 Tax=Larkinella sp. VNQ87 TaxID=3400921 RepID=UPI003C07A256
MKFFIPFITEESQLKRVYERIVAYLIKLGYEPLTDRVYQVDYELDGKLTTEAVGRVSETSREVVMAIFKNDRGYLICSYSRGVASGHPIIAHYKHVKTVIDFSQDNES